MNTKTNPTLLILLGSLLMNDGIQAAQSGTGISATPLLASQPFIPKLPNIFNQCASLLSENKDNIVAYNLRPNKDAAVEKFKQIVSAVNKLLTEKKLIISEVDDSQYGTLRITLVTASDQPIDTLTISIRFDLLDIKELCYPVTAITVTHYEPQLGINRFNIYTSLIDNKQNLTFSLRRDDDGSMELKSVAIEMPSLSYDIVSKGLRSFRKTQDEYKEILPMLETIITKYKKLPPTYFE